MNELTFVFISKTGERSTIRGEIQWLLKPKQNSRNPRKRCLLLALVLARPGSPLASTSTTSSVAAVPNRRPNPVKRRIPATPRSRKLRSSQ